jgi:deoxyribonuclease V
MGDVDSAEWPKTVDEAITLQSRLRSRVDATVPAGFAPRTAAGLDVAYEAGSDRLVGAVVVVDLDTLTVVDQAVATGVANFPYVPGLFAFRELPVLLDALAALTTVPDVLICDGNGLAHPRRFGLACHLGVTTGRTTFGVAKTPMGDYEPPGEKSGAWTPLTLDGEPVGRALRTRAGVKPVFVSIGHRIDLATACLLTLRLCPKYRVPETTRLADQLGRGTLRDSGNLPQG